jgi:hypothetical protein
MKRRRRFSVAWWAAAAALLSLLLGVATTVGVARWGERLIMQNWWHPQRPLPACSYNRAGIAKGAVCPECGEKK